MSPDNAADTAPDDGPTVDEAKAADVVHKDDPANADLPTDVKDGEVPEEG